MPRLPALLLLRVPRLSLLIRLLRLLETRLQVAGFSKAQVPASQDSCAR
jgi:hypothetical protein